jgi:hypothetical protein
MTRSLASLMMTGVFALGAVGCSDTTSVETEKKVSTPGGTTTETTEKKIEKSGENPPPAP